MTQTRTALTPYCLLNLCWPDARALSLALMRFSRTARDELPNYSRRAGNTGELLEHELLYIKWGSTIGSSWIWE